MSIYCITELKDLDVDEILSGIRYIDPEDLVVLYQEKIRRLEIRLRNSENINADLTKENEKLIASIDKLNKEKNKIDGNRSSMRFQFGILQERLTVAESSIKELMAENARYLQLNKDLKESVKKLKEEREILSTKQVYFEDQIKTLNATCEGYADNINAYRKEVDQLTQENKKLIEERDALWDETQHLDKIYKQLLNEKKRLQENFEELKASSDLSMTAELAEIFAEFTDKDKENRDDLSVKIDEFRKKYQFE